MWSPESDNKEKNIEIKFKPIKPNGETNKKPSDQASINTNQLEDILKAILLTVMAIVVRYFVIVDIIINFFSKISV